MATSPMSEAIRHLRTAVLRDGAALTDGQLLEEYVRRRDAAALAALVRRHAPMVWGVCRRILRNYHDAEDAFQATFLVLVRRAAAVVPRAMVGNWLYGVAHQTALKARATAARRTRRERPMTDTPDPAAVPHQRRQELRPLLDQELSRLPDRYRTVLVLCDLEGKTRKEAARQLRCPEGTVAGRLARARTLLAKRLTRHGPALSGAALAVLLAQGTASASVPTAVLSSTIAAVSLLAAGQLAAPGMISASAAALTEGVVRSMLLTKWKLVLVLALIAALGGAAGLVYQTPAAEPPQTPRAEERADTRTPPVAAKDKKPRPDRERLQGTWKMVSYVDDGEKDEELGDEWDINDRTIKAIAPAKRKRGAYTSYLRFRLDETTHPRLIDLVEGKADDLFDPAAFDRRLDDADARKEGIYAFAGDTLRMCISRKKGERPTAFASKRGSDCILIVLQRVRPKAVAGGNAIKVAKGPQEYKGLFLRMLTAVAERCEQITYANQYDGRIEARTVDANGSGIIREATVYLLPCDDGGFSITVRVMRIKQVAGKWEVVGRDTAWERALLRIPASGGR